MSTTTQTFAGNKTFSGALTLATTTIAELTISGALSVNGTSTLATTTASALNVTGTSTLATTSITALSGAGLTNCSGSSNALQYNETTKQFSCGTISGSSTLPDTETFTDATVGTVVLTTGNTELFDAVDPRPNITPATASSTVMVAVTVRHTADDNLPGSGFVKVVRAIGANPSCTTDTSIGEFAISPADGNAGVYSGGSGTFLDTPASTNNVRYTLCTTGTGEDDTTINDIRFVLAVLGADIAENYYTVDDTLEAGDIVAVDASLPAGARKASAGSTAVFGIVSTAPAHTLDDGIGIGSGRPVPIALKGRVPVKVTNEGGVIETGDRIALSLTRSGYGKKAVAGEATVGIALSSFAGEEGKVLVYVENEQGQLVDPYEKATTESLTAAADESPVISVLQYLTEKITGAIMVVKEMLVERIVAVQGYFESLFATQYCGVLEDGSTHCFTASDIKRLREDIETGAGTSSTAITDELSWLENALASIVNSVATTTNGMTDGLSTTTQNLSGLWSSSDTEILYVKDGLSVGIGTSTPSKKLHVQISTSGSPVRFQDSEGYCEIDPTSTTWTCASDARLKTNVQTIESTLDGVLALNPVNFDWKSQVGDDEEGARGARYGLIAQEVEDIFPHLVSTDEETGLKSVAYGGLTIPMLKAMQEIATIASSTAGLTRIGEDGIETKTFLGQFFDRMIAWFADAKNGIGKLFAESVDTKELCLTDRDGTSCYTRTQLNAALGSATTSQTQSILDSTNSSSSDSSNMQGATTTSSSTTATEDVTSSAAVVATTTESGSVDTTAPVLALVGDTEINLFIDDAYIEQGAIAIDDVDGDISSSINIVGSVDTSTAGTYMVTYNVTDTAGNSAASLTRTVSVAEKPAVQEGVSASVVTPEEISTTDL